MFLFYLITATWTSYTEFILGFCDMTNLRFKNFNCFPVWTLKRVDRFGFKYMYHYSRILVMYFFIKIKQNFDSLSCLGFQGFLLELQVLVEIHHFPFWSHQYPLQNKIWFMSKSTQIYNVFLLNAKSTKNYTIVNIKILVGCYYAHDFYIGVLFNK